MGPHQALAKGLSVVNSCKTDTQLVNAAKFVRLCINHTAEKHYWTTMNNVIEYAKAITKKEKQLKSL